MLELSEVDGVKEKLKMLHRVDIYNIEVGNTLFVERIE